MEFVDRGKGLNFACMSMSIIIIGAGASGLLAAHRLSAAGYRVTVVEAAAIPGGRILTLREGFTVDVEAGAEFIHGELPISLQLAHETGVDLVPLRSEMLCGSLLLVLSFRRQGEWRRGR